MNRQCLPPNACSRPIKAAVAQRQLFWCGGGPRTVVGMGLLHQTAILVDSPQIDTSTVHCHCHIHSLDQGYKLDLAKENRQLT